MAGISLRLRLISHFYCHHSWLPSWLSLYRANHGYRFKFIAHRNGRELVALPLGCVGIVDALTLDLGLLRRVRFTHFDSSLFRPCSSQLPSPVLMPITYYSYYYKAKQYGTFRCLSNSGLIGQNTVIGMPRKTPPVCVVAV